MGRVKIDIKKIENVTSRQVTFSKRKAGLFKKCRELSVLCDAEVATMIFSHTGRYYGYASSGCMRSTIERYTSIDRTIDCPLMEIENYPVMDILARDDMGEINGARLELSSLKLKRRTLEKIYNILMGEDLDILSWDCLEVYENIMVSAFSKVKAKKEELFIEKEARYQHKIQCLEAQNRNQQKMIQETQSFIARLPSFINKDIMNFSLNIDPYVMNINPYGGSFY